MIDHSPRYARALVEVLAAIAIGVIAVVFFARYSFPIELEWMEANTLRAAERLRDGLPIYAEPSDEWVPALYTPLYPWLVSFLSQFAPLDYPLARTISIAGSAAVGLGLYVLVRGEDKPRAHGLTAVAVLIVGYVFTFRWLDVGRADSMFVALTLWSLIVLRRATDTKDLPRAAAAGVLMSLAFWTKQTAAVFVLMGGLAALTSSVALCIAFAVPIAILCGLGVFWGNAQTDGWLWVYIYELHQTHAFNAERFWSKTWLMFLHGLPVLVIWFGWRTALAFTDLLAPPDSDHEFGPPGGRLGGGRYWGAMALAGLIASALGYATQWAEPNAFIPGVVFIAAFVGVVQPIGGARERIGTVIISAHLLFAGALEADYYTIKSEGWAGGLIKSYRLQTAARTVPTGETLAQARHFTAERAHWPGPLFAPQHGWWARTRGEPGHVSSMGLNDVTRAWREKLRTALRTRVTAREFGTIWIEGSLGSGWAWLRPRLAAGYRLAERRRGSARVRPLVGFMSDAGMEVAYEGEQLRFERIEPPTPPRAGELVIAEFERDFRPFEIDGFGFGDAPAMSVDGKLPAIGPISGARILSSAASVDGIAGKGKAVSQPFALPAAGGELRLLAGRVGPGKGVTISIHEVGGDDRWVALEIPGHHFGLAPVHWLVSDGWANTRVQMVVEDNSAESALFVDRIEVHQPQ